ncbi:hypothetical protein D8674_022302 [Pyrus ussuriensis x Pyrus communis]|uniref:Uncharacterized protein n=1 Tax=Pyrus ussuriensis x Pyrus communis TaxID=2448454 RepID=A0A5N5GY74_9ROSA|nr:hypothetical protein D8674_022302 [Pyrus ussuriensis x Pyrus communis]
MPSPLASFLATTSLPERVRKFGQIRTKLRSLKYPSEPQHLQDQCRVFRQWMQRDFSASFSLKALQKAERMTKVQYQSFISFFENLRALRDYLAMEDQIMVVAIKIQKLEEQLSALKAEQITLSSKLYKKIKELKRVNHEVEESEAQLANSNIALEELGRIFTIMQTYHHRIDTLAKDVNLLG